MAKVTPILWIHKKNGQGLSPIYLRIAAGEKTRYLSLRVRVRESQWNPKAGRVRRSHKHAVRINAMIADRVAEAEGEILKLQAEKETVTAQHLKESLAPSSVSDAAINFFAYADGIIADHEKRGQLYTHKRYKSICKKFRTFTGEPLPFEKLTPQLLRKYETHLIEHHGNAPNTVASNFRAIRAILYKAIKEGLFPQEENPFFQFKIKRVRPNRDKLSIQELKAIEDLPLEGGSLLWHVRNYFLFAFYCAGIRFGDLAKLRQRNIVNGRLVYRMSKTDKTKSIKLLTQAQQIIAYYLPHNNRNEVENPEAYLFPILESYDLSTSWKRLNAISAQNTLANKYLKKIAELAGLECKLSFHVARHSFADFARRSGWDVYLISKALGHTSIKITESYLKGFDQEALDERMEELFVG